MTFKTHIAFAESIALPPALYGYTHHLLSLEELKLYATAVAVGALLPDIDHTNSYISKRVPLIPQILAFYTKHRGFTHSAMGIIFIGMLLTILVLSKFLSSILAIGFFVGYTLHILGDAMTVSGIKDFCCGKGLYLLPKFLRFKTGSWAENIYFLIFSSLALFEISLVQPKLASYLQKLFFHSVAILEKSL